MGEHHVVGWKLDRQERDMLLARFPPNWPDVDADHVTLQSHVAPDCPLPRADSGQIVGWVNDGAGLQALVVRIDGATNRPDGGTYHITWSLDCGRGRRPVESNDVLETQGWQPIDDPIPIRLIPARFG